MYVMVRIRSLRIQEGISTECLFEELEKHG